MSKSFKYGIIGAGSMGREHIRNVNIIDEAEIVALSDPHDESINQSLSLLNKKVPCFTNYNEMIQSLIVVHNGFSTKICFFVLITSFSTSI